MKRIQITAEEVARSSTLEASDVGRWAVLVQGCYQFTSAPAEDCDCGPVAGVFFPVNPTEERSYVERHDACGVFEYDDDAAEVVSALLELPIERDVEGHLYFEVGGDEALRLARAAIARRQALVDKANEDGRLSRRAGAPVLTMRSSREQLLAWLQWNDGNGCYVDEVRAAGQAPPLTLREAWEALALVLSDDSVPAAAAHSVSG